MNIVKTSPNGNLRLRKFKNGKGVVELKTFDGSWVYCIWRSCEWDQAVKTFENQVKHHQLEDE